MRWSPPFRRRTTRDFVTIDFKRIEWRGGDRDVPRAAHDTGATPGGVTSMDCTNASSAGDGQSPSDNDHRTVDLHRNSNELNGEGTYDAPCAAPPPPLQRHCHTVCEGGPARGRGVFRRSPRHPDSAPAAPTPRTPSRRPRRASEVVNQSSLASSQRSRSLDERKEFEDLKFTQSGPTQTQQEQVVRRKPQTR